MADFHLRYGAQSAPDGIPLHYGDLSAEFEAALRQAVMMDRSHEGRLEVTGRDRAALLHRISTNNLLEIPLNAGRPSIFTNANGRILDRVTLYNRGDWFLALTEPGRGAAFTASIQRQIFFQDEVRLADITTTTRQFNLHGPHADTVIETFLPGAAAFAPFQGAEIVIAGVPVFITRRPSLAGAHWAVIFPADAAETIWQALLDAGTAYGLLPAGSLTYNTLRIRAGRPAAGRELSPDYIPLEVGLWDEVSFTKGCYTGQEIIARMESRQRLAKTIVTLRLDAWIESPVELFHEGKPAGMLTSSVTTPKGEHLGIGVIKLPLAIPGTVLTASGQDVGVYVVDLPGAQPPYRISPSE